MEQLQPLQRKCEWTRGNTQSTQWSVRKALPAPLLRKVSPLRSCWTLSTSSNMKTTLAVSSSAISVSALLPVSCWLFVTYPQYTRIGGTCILISYTLPNEWHRLDTWKWKLRKIKLHVQNKKAGVCLLS